MVRRYFQLMGEKPPSSFAQIEKTIRRHDQPGLERLLIPFLNDALTALRLLEINAARSARPAHRLGLPGSPYARLEQLIHDLLIRAAELPTPIRKIEDFKILPSESLLALNILKVAGTVLPPSNRFARYYEENLWSGKALLRTAVNWAQWDELFVATLLGENQTARVRGSSNHLPYLALWNLMALDPVHRTDYLALFERHRLFLHNDLNAMTDMIRKTGLR